MSGPTPQQIESRQVSNNAIVQAVLLKKATTSCYGKPLPLAYGTVRLPGNVIWAPMCYVNGTSLGFLMAICEGPVIAAGAVTAQSAMRPFGRIWIDQAFPYAGLDEINNPGGYAISAALQLFEFEGGRPQANAFSYGTATADAAHYKDNQFSFTLSASLDGFGNTFYDYTVPNGSPISGGGTPSWTSDAVVSVWDFTLGTNLVMNAPPGPSAEASVSALGTNIYCVSGAGPYRFAFHPSKAGHLMVVTYHRATLSYTVAYGGTAFIGTRGLDSHVGASNIPNLTTEVTGFAGFAGTTVNPADIINDLLTSTTYGCGFSYSVEVTNGQDGTAASGYRRACAQIGYLLAAAFKDRRSALDHTRWILQASNAELLWSGNTLKVVPLGDTVVGSFSPVVTAQYALTKDDFLVGSGADPITVVRKSAAQTFNDCPIEYTSGDAIDPLNLYNVVVAESVEQADAIATGSIRKEGTLSLQCINSFSVADMISRIRAQRSSYIRNTYTFQLGWRHARLEPLDIVSLTESVLGYAALLVRVTDIEEDGMGVLTVTAEDFIQGVNYAVARSYTP